MEPGSAAVLKVLSDFAESGSVESRRPVATGFEAVAVVLSRAEPGSGVVEDIADHAMYLDSASDIHVLLALPALEREGRPEYGTREDDAAWFSQDEAETRWPRLLEFTRQKDKKRRDELKTQLAGSANELREELGLSDSAMPGILFIIYSEKKAILIRLRNNFRLTSLFGKLKESYTQAPGGPLEMRLTRIAEQAGMASREMKRPKIVERFEDWSAISFDDKQRKHPAEEHTIA